MVGKRRIDTDTDKHKSFSEMLESALSMIAPHQRVILEGRSGASGNPLSYAILAERLGRGLVETDVMVPRIRDAEGRALQKMINVGVFDDFSVAWTQYFSGKRPSHDEIIEASEKSVPLRGAAENIEWAFYVLRKVCHIRPVHDEDPLIEDEPSGLPVEKDLVDDLDPEGWPEGVMRMPVDRMPFHPAIIAWCVKYGVKKPEDMLSVRNDFVSFLERPENESLRLFLINQVSLWQEKLPNLSKHVQETRFWQSLQFSMARLTPEASSVLSMRIGYPMGDPIPVAQVAERLGIPVDRAMSVEHDAAVKFFDNDLWQGFTSLWSCDTIQFDEILSFEDKHQWLKGLSENIGMMMHLAEKVSGKHWQVSKSDDTLIFLQRNAGNDGIKMS